MVQTITRRQSPNGLGCLNEVSSMLIKQLIIGKFCGCAFLDDGVIASDAGLRIRWIGLLAVPVKLIRGFM
jgi:hypothetical protein